MTTTPPSERNPAEEFLMERGIVGSRSAPRRSVLECLARHLGNHVSNEEQGSGEQGSIATPDIISCSGIPRRTGYSIMAALLEKGVIAQTDPGIGLRGIGDRPQANYVSAPTELGAAFAAHLRPPHLQPPEACPLKDGRSA